MHDIIIARIQVGVTAHGLSAATMKDNYWTLGSGGENLKTAWFFDKESWSMIAESFEFVTSDSASFAAF